MVSGSGRYTLVLNGEVYNHRSLRTRLQGLGHVFRGTSDTEVLLAAIEQWGVVSAVERCTGMFALGVWDNASRTLSLARDRLGEKPLYVARRGRCVAFASELRAIRGLLGASLELDPMGLQLYLKYGYVPEPFSILSGARKVLPATIESWKLHDQIMAGPETIRYWHPLQDDGFLPTDRDAAIAELERRLARAASEQLVADVPVGCLLSGGIDSTAVAAMAQHSSARPIRTFSIGFDDPSYNEAHFAKAVANHLGTDHTELEVGMDSLLELVPEMASIYDEPFGDASQIPTTAVCRLARRSVKVCLTGDGGDELFGGYNRYYWPDKLRRTAGFLGKPGRMFAASTLFASSRRLPDWLIGPIASIAVGSGPVQDFRGKLSRASRVLREDDSAAAYLSLVTRLAPDSVLRDRLEADDPLADELPMLFARHGELPGATLWDTLHYLPGDNLVKVDRASMSVGLETRAPLLNHYVFQLARTMLKTFDRSSFERSPKWPLRAIAYRSVPEALLQRPKMGFSVPMAQWLRNELRAWAETQISPAAIDERGILAQEPVADLWRRHQSGEADKSSELWTLLALQTWHLHCTRVGGQPADFESILSAP
jgi:asparagine synthase (glutamine-hydrolysing)